jgi:Carboxypeptidase regulatory-like domain
MASASEGTRGSEMSVRANVRPLRVMGAVLAATVLAGAARQNRAGQSTAIEGTVTTRATNTRLAGALVVLWSEGLALRSVRTAADGTFRLTGVAAGAYSLTVRRAGYLDGAYPEGREWGWTPTFTVDGLNRPTIHVALAERPVLSGRVVDDSGEPVTAGQVRLFRRFVLSGRERYTAGGSARTDDRGEFRFDDLEPGAYLLAVPNVLVTLPGDGREQAPPGSAVKQLLAAAGVTGALERPGPVTVGDSEVIASLAPPVMDAQGGVLVAPTAFLPSGRAPADALPVDLAPGGRESVVLQMPRVRGFRLRGRIATGMPQVLVTLVSGARAALERDLVVAGTVTETDGSFRLEGIAPGFYRLRVSERPSASSEGFWLDLPVTTGDTNVDVAVLHPEAWLHLAAQVRVASTGTAPRPRLAGLRWTVEPVDGAFPDSVPRGTIDGSGRFEAHGLRPGAYAIRIHGLPAPWIVESVMNAGATDVEARLDLRANAENLVVTLSDRSGTMTGSVTGSAASGNHGVGLLFPADRRRWTDYGVSSPRFAAAPVRGGIFELEQLPPGDYLALAVSGIPPAIWQEASVLERLASRASRLTVPASGSTHVALRLAGWPF